MTISKLMNDEGRLMRRRARWTPKKVIDILRNPTYLGRLPFNGEVYEAAHEPLVAEELFRQAGHLLLERGESRVLRGRAASDYLVGGLMRCARCGHGFIGTVAHGRNAAYRYYTCYPRLRHGTARCDQDRIPAEPVEDAVISVTLEALREPSFFEECARLARQEWEQANPGRERRLARIGREVAKKREAIDRYLRAFELGKLSEATCGYRLKELEKEVAALEGQRAAIQAECEEAPAMPDGRPSRRSRTGHPRRRRWGLDTEAEGSAGVRRRRDRRGVSREHHALLQPARGSTAVPSAEADGNRTRLGAFAPTPVLKTGGPTRRPDASMPEDTPVPRVPSPRRPLSGRLDAGGPVLRLRPGCEDPVAEGRAPRRRQRRARTRRRSRAGGSPRTRRPA